MLEVLKVTTGGNGLAKDKDGAIFIPRTLPGELIEPLEIERKRGVRTVKKYEIAKESEFRVKPKCPYYGKCGGCDFLFVDPAEGARLKEEIIKDNLRRIGKLKSLPPFEPIAIGKSEGYRARMRLHVSFPDKAAGFLKESSNEIVPIKHCQMLEQRLDAILIASSMLIQLPEVFGVDDPKKNPRFEIPYFNADDDELLHNNMEGVRTIAGIQYHVASNVFFQSNPSLLPELLTFVKENVVGWRIMDLYSGVGTFSALFEDGGYDVTAVERDEKCLALSRMNAPSAKSYSGDVFFWGRRRREKVDTVIVDPPRTGLGKDVVELISSWKAKRIIYVSCNSVTLSRDIEYFSPKYEPTLAKVFDFYPGSSHEESCVVLDRV